ncbi:MAG: hypothetical protein RL662_170 [Bacteroidota bacterium]|jgi:16S rRNA (uracil1498-N3)-methyltransferase
MEKVIFYAPQILSDNLLPEDESGHCIRVLRKKEGDGIFITDGEGHFFDAIITNPHPKRCLVEIVKTIDHPKGWNNTLHIAFAPTKNLDRVEWFAEKATEIGIDCITPLLTRHSERKEIKTPRIQKIVVSAMKQSQKASLPVLSEMVPFVKFIKQSFVGQKFIAHCHAGEKPLLKDIYTRGEDVLILIGPEGDFSEQEVEQALKEGFVPISLGNSRLRTETAALVACNTVQIMNE